MDSNQEQKVVLITGASAGIGEATALEYAKLGYQVAITGRNADRLGKVLAALIANSPIKTNQADNFLALNADFEVPAQVEPIVEQTVAKFGRLDILVNNAGYPGKQRLIHDEDFFEDFQNIIQVNLLAATRIAQLAIPELKKSRGVIINISSVADSIPLVTVSYSVSKAGLSMLTKSLANALDGTGVRAITVSPGPIATNIVEDMEKFAPMTSLNRIGQPKEVADLILFLTSQKGSFINGCTMTFDGGLSVKSSNPAGSEKL